MTKKALHLDPAAPDVDVVVPPAVPGSTDDDGQDDREDDVTPLAAPPGDGGGGDDDHSQTSDLDAALAEIEAELAAADEQKAAIEARKVALVGERDALLETLDAQRDPNHNMTEIQRYLVSQQAAREARGEQLRRVRASGVDLNALLPQKPPIDAARARKKPKG